MPTLHLYLPEDVYERLRELSERLGVKTTELARRAIEGLVGAAVSDAGEVLDDSRVRGAILGERRGLSLCVELAEALARIARLNALLLQRLAECEAERKVEEQCDLQRSQG